MTSLLSVIRFKFKCSGGYRAVDPAYNPLATQSINGKETACNTGSSPGNIKLHSHSIVYKSSKVAEDQERLTERSKVMLCLSQP